MPQLLNELQTPIRSAIPMVAGPAAGPGAWPPAGPGGWQNPWSPPDDPAEASVPLSHYIWILRRHRWKILAFVAACVIATFIISSRVTPIYEATATIDVDRRAPAGVLGEDASQTATPDTDQFLATQVKLIGSDSVLRPVARRLHLKTEDSVDGDQRPEAEEAPVKLKNLQVTRPPNTFLLLISYRSPNPRLAADVSNAIAQSYIEHTYNIRYRATAGLSTFMEKQLEELRAKMERSSTALTGFERELNVINPEEKTSILSSRLLQLNTEYTNAQAERVRKEAAYNSIRGGSLEAAQVSTQGEALKKLAERLNELQEKFAQVKGQYGPSHPEYRKVSAQLVEVQAEFERTTHNIGRRIEVEYREALNRESMLKQAVAETKTEFDRVNARSFEYQSLKREADADKKLYEELVTKIKEAGINAGFQNSAIRLADPARAAIKPVFPNIRLNLALACLFATLVAVGAAVISDVLDNTIRDAEQVARIVNTEVVGSLPLVKSWRNRLPAPIKSGSKDLVPVQQVVPRTGGNDRSFATFEEAVRTLRNSILLGQFGQSLKTILVTSASPGEGKTTAAVHLAIAHAEQKHRTLLIDCDLRRPGIQRALAFSPDEPGLSNALNNGMVWRDKLIKIEGVDDLDVLSAGPVGRRTCDLLGPRLPGLLAEAESEYELVILDAPPLLGFPEPLQLAAAVDGVLVISLAGKTSRKAVTTVVNTLKRLQANVLGLVLNEVTRDLSDDYHYYGYYGKYGRYYGNYAHRDGGKNS